MTLFPLGALISLDRSLSRHLCSGAMEMEGFDEKIPQKELSYDEWLARCGDGKIPPLNEVFQILRDVSHCRIFTLKLGLGASDQWEIYRFEVRCAERFSYFFVYPDEKRLVVQYIPLCCVMRVYEFEDIRHFIMAIKKWFCDGLTEATLNTL